MSHFRLRQTTRISYHELEEPSFDEYVYCDKCCDYVYEYCSIHGPLVVIPDDKVVNVYIFEWHALQPNGLIDFSLRGAGLGVFATLTLPQGVRFGPFRGRRTHEVNSAYCWQIYDSNNKPLHMIDGADITHSNWMRYVNCARHCREQNLIAYQYQGDVYYRTIRMIPRSTELLVFYGSGYAGTLNVDLRKYNSKNYYLEAIGYDRSSMQQMNHIETEDSQKIHYEEVTSTTTTTVEISSAECIYSKNGIQERYETEDDFQYLGDSSNITGHSQTIEENQLKVEYNSGNHCFDTEFHNNDRNEFTDQTKIPNQEMELDWRSENHQQINFKQIDSEMQIYFKVNTNVKDTRADSSSASYSVLAENYQLYTAALNSENQPIDNFPYNTYFNNKASNSDNKNMFIKLVNKDKEQREKETWQCNYCHKILSKFSLKKHAKIHDDKKCNCPKCNYTTHSKDQLNNHMPIHTGIYEFKCDICPFGTKSLSNLQRHCRRMHENDNFICKLCSYTAPSKLTMVYHRSLHGKENVRKCDFCDYLTNKNRYLNKHVRTVHGNLKKELLPGTDG